MTRHLRTVASAAAAAAALAFLLTSLPIQPARADAAPKAAKPLLLVKSGDWQRITAQAAAGSVSLPVPALDACGGPYNWPCSYPGAPVQVSASYQGVMRIARLAAHVTILFDDETWPETPARQHVNAMYWLCKAARAVRALHEPGVRLIETPYDTTAALILAEDVQAVKCGAYGVDVQSQFTDSKPWLFRWFVTADIQAMRKVRKHVVILAGISTNGPAGFLSVPVLVKDFRYAMAAGANGIWANVPDWGVRNKCGAAQGGPGCPEIGIRFLQAIGLAS